MISRVNVLRVAACCVLLQLSSAGWCAAPPNPTASDEIGNTAGGTDALINFSSSNPNTAFGFSALKANTSGGFNTAFGYNALSSNTGFGGDSNTAVGHEALLSNTEGFLNVAVGSDALHGNIDGTNNVAVGASALAANKNGRGSTAVGSGALATSLSSFANTAIGQIALFNNTTGSSNTANGVESLYNNTTGERNTATGVMALRANSIGKWNTSSGESSLLKNTTGQGNSAFGLQALMNSLTGNNNIALGINAGANLTAGSNNVYLANAGTATESSTIRIGSNHTRTFIAGIRARKTGVANAVPVVIDSLGQLGTINSSARFKKDIHDMASGSQALYKLRPVTYRYKEADDNGDNPLEYGLIAEEVAKVYPDLVAYGADGQIETVQYHKLTPMLLNEIQRLAKENASMKDQLYSEQTKYRQLQQDVDALTRQAHLIQVLTERLESLEAAQLAVLSR